MKRSLILTLATVLLCYGMNVFAHGSSNDGFMGDLMVTRHFTGAWDQVEHESQGLVIEVIDQVDGSSKSVAYWYTYGADRKSAWYLGIGNLEADQIIFDLYEPVDVGFLQPEDPDTTPVQSVGTLTIVFDSCDTGVVTYETDHDELGSGNFNIARVSRVLNTHCSGGISDNMHADATFGVQRINLTSAREGITGNGQATYEDYPGHMEFEVEVEDLPDGDYHLYAGMQNRGTFTVVDGRGRLDFSSPGEAGKMTLTFDPRGMQIEIHDDQGIVLSSFENRFEVGGHPQYGNVDNGHDFNCGSGHGPGHGMGQGMRNCVADGEVIEIEVDFINTGVLASAAGEAEWSLSANRVEFSVEIENIPVGSYSLKVGGVERGAFEAFEMNNGEVYGRIRFQDPESRGREHLDFEPRGELVEVLQGDAVILEVEFPAE